LTFPRLDDERVDVGVAAEDDERLGLLVDGAGRLAVGGVDGAELDAGEGRLLVVGVGVALDFEELGAVEDRALDDECLDDAGREAGGLVTMPTSSSVRSASAAANMAPRAGFAA
jgi:hypothetical protein